MVENDNIRLKEQRKELRELVKIYKIKLLYKIINNI